MKTDAFEQQASRLRAVALKASASAGADADTAQDIAQETMIRLWQMRDDPRLCNLDGYTAMIARHLTLNHLRRRQPLPIDERRCNNQTAPSPLDLMVQREEEQWLKQRIRICRPHSTLSCTCVKWSIAPMTKSPHCSASKKRASAPYWVEHGDNC